MLSADRFPAVSSLLFATPREQHIKGTPLPHQNSHIKGRQFKHWLIGGGWEGRDKEMKIYKAHAMAASAFGVRRR